jgi:phosphatidylinositol alpha-1,6-mannosyltransferase
MAINVKHFYYDLQYAMKLKLKLLFLTLDGFSKTGGIQSVCKTLVYTLNSLALKSKNMEFTNLSLHDHVPDEHYISSYRFKGFQGNKIRFFLNALKIGLSGDIIIVSHINLLLVAAAIKLIHRKAKIIMLAHGTEVWRKIPAWKKIVLKRAVTIWAVSNHTKRALTIGHGIGADSIFVLNNCLDPFFKFPKSMAKAKKLCDEDVKATKRPIMISVCRISNYERAKGYDLTLMAIPDLLPEFPDLHYFMIGQGEPSELQRIKKIIDDLAIREHVTLVGHVTQEDLSMYYLLADVFVLPSSKEGFGLVFIEAASHGCKVVCGNQDGSKETLLGEKLGISIDISNPTNLRQELEISFRMNRSLRVRQNLQNLCEKHFNQRKYEMRVKKLLI